MMTIIGIRFAAIIVLPMIFWLDTSQAEMISPAATTNSLPAKIINAYEMAFVYLPPGEFQMGSPPDEPGRKPNERHHTVTLSKGFYMMTTEVTQKQWTAVMGNNPSAFDDCGPDCPVENISWEMVQQFIKKLNDQAKTVFETVEGKNSSIDKKPTAAAQPNPLDQAKYHLPTEAQWEYVCRAGNQGWFHFDGDTKDLAAYAWFKANADSRPHPVARKKPNGFGLFDMHVNLWEWCQDKAGPYAPKKKVDPIGSAKGRFRIARGGSWFYSALMARCANRLYLPPEASNYNVGFRLVLTVKK